MKPIPADPATITRMSRAWMAYQVTMTGEPPAWLVQHVTRLAERRIMPAGGADRAAMAVMFVCIHCGTPIEEGAVVCTSPQCLTRDDSLSRFGG